MKLLNNVAYKLVLLFMAGLFFSSTIAHAATCTVNGNMVPCEEFGKIGAIILAFGFGFVFLIAALSITAFIFWIVMLIHAASNEIPEKIVWVIILIFTGLIGAIIYYFVVKRKFDKKVLSIYQEPSGDISKPSVTTETK